MDWLTFISKIIESIIWPVVVLVIALTFKGKITDLISNLKLSQFKFKDLEMMFETLSKKSELVAEQKEVIKHKLATEELPPEDRATITDQLEGVVKEETMLNQRRQQLVSTLRGGRLSPGKEAILADMIHEVIGTKRAASIPESMLMSLFPILAREIRAGKHPGHNGGSLTALWGAGIIDESDQLTSTGAALIKTMAMEMAPFADDPAYASPATPRVSP